MAKQELSTFYKQRSLYQCLNAKVKRDRIYCGKGHRLGTSKDGTIPLTKLIRGSPLIFSICQICEDYDEMGPGLSQEERGWAEDSRR